MANKYKSPVDLDELTLTAGDDHISGGTSYLDSGYYDNTFTISSSAHNSIDTISIGSTSMGTLNNSVLTAGTTGHFNWNATTYTAPMAVGANGSIALQGDGADITINGVKLSETLKALQERLNVLVPNPELEKEWEDLAELGRQYRELEQHITEKMAVWDKLKSLPKIDVK